MSYQVRYLDAVLDPKWDALVEATAGGDLVQTSVWAVSRQKLGIRAYHVVAANPDGLAAAGCMLYVNRLIPGVNIGRIPRGPLLFSEAADLASAFIDDIIAACRGLGIVALIVQPPEGAAAVQTAIVDADFRLGAPNIAPEATIRIDIRRSDDEIIRCMSARRRTSLRKALNQGFDVREDGDVELFHQLHVATASRRGFSPVTLENQRAQWDVLSPHSMCTMFIARYGGAPVAGLWLTRFANTVTFKLPGWDWRLHAPAHVNAALHWTAIRWAREKGAEIYDFGGFDRQGAELILAGKALPEQFLKSPSFFKISFGGAPVLLPEARFAFTDPLIHAVVGRFAGRCFPAVYSTKLVQRMRNGAGALGIERIFETLFRVAVLCARPVHSYARHVTARLHDHHFGIVTTDSRVAHMLGRSQDAHLRAYPFTRVTWIMRHLDPQRDDVFLDYGCGAGRVICIAARWPFSRVLGVEIDEELCEIARRNVRALKRPMLLPGVICADAATYRVPDDVTVVFLYNPFGTDTMRETMRRVLESFDRVPRPMRIIYANPREHHVISSMGRFCEEGTLRFSWRPGKQWLRTQIVKTYKLKSATVSELRQ